MRNKPFLQAFPLAAPTIVTSGAELVGLVGSLTNWLFIGFLLAAVVFVIIAAFQFLTGGGDPTSLGSAKKKLIWAVVAIIIAVLARTIPLAVENIITGTGGGDTLTVSVTNTPSSGTAPLDSFTTGSIGGTATGPWSATRTCGGGSTPAETVTGSGKIFAFSPCTYTTAATYTVSVSVTRASVTAVGTAPVMVTGAGGGPTVSVSHLPTSPNSTQTVLFSITASDPDGLMSGETKIRIDENGDGMFEFSSPCAASSGCSVTRGPYAAGLTVKYTGVAKDSLGNVGASPLPDPSFTVTP